MFVFYRFHWRITYKLQYAKQLYGEGLTVCDLKCCNINEALSADIIINIQEAVKSMLLLGESPSDYFKVNIDKFKDKILIGNEIGCDIVPIDAFEREWRDETGWVYQFLGSNAKRVDRVWAGIGQILKK
jgi:adenosylcobinamide kinase/adenosylcobinamide-phosphate guanylyltransferase